MRERERERERENDNDNNNTLYCHQPVYSYLTLVSEQMTINLHI